MIHFIPESPETAPEATGPYAEAVARLASIRQALACVEQFSGQSPSESLVEMRLAAAWPAASPARQRVYDRRSGRAAAAAAAGLEALASLRENGRQANSNALERLKSELKSNIESIDLLFSL